MFGTGNMFYYYSEIFVTFCVFYCCDSIAVVFVFIESLCLELE